MKIDMKSNLFVFVIAILAIYSCGDGNSQAATGDQGPSVSSSVPSSSVNRAGSYQRIAQTPDANRKLGNLDISIEVQDVQDGSFFLMGVFTDQYYLADSSVSRSGVVKFKKDEAMKPGTYFLYFPDKQTSLQILLDEDQKFSMKTDMGNLVGSMEVKGSLDNELLYKALKFERSQQADLTKVSQNFQTLQVGTPEHDQSILEHKKLMDDKMTYLRELFVQSPKSMFTTFKEAGQNPNIVYEFNSDGSLGQEYLTKLRAQYWENVNLADERLLYTPVISNKLEKHFTTHMPQNPDSIKRYATMLVDASLPYPEYLKYFANWITLKFEPTKTSLMDAEAVYVHMIQNYFTKERAFWQDSVQSHGLQLRAYEMGQSLVGLKGPDVTAKGPDGKMYSIYELKADYIAVFLWNPECEHCQEQSPKLVKFHNEWKHKGFDVYGIVLDTDDAAWKRAIQSYGMAWTNVHDPTNRSIYAKYFVDNTPELYLLNPERTIIGKNLKVFQLEQVIEQDKANRQ